jgi:hypothetical protein
MSDLPAPSSDDAVSDDEVSDGAGTQPVDGVSDEERREALLEDTPEEIEARAPGLVETGNPVVDEVIASLEGLDGIPVDEHVSLFEQAHEQLRRTLSGAGDNQG